MVVGFLNGLGIALLRIHPGHDARHDGRGAGQSDRHQGEMIGTTPPLMARLIASPLILGIPGVIFIWLALGVLMWLLLNARRTASTCSRRHEPHDRAAVRRARAVVVILTYMLSGMLAGFGGFVLLGFSQTVFLQLGNNYLFPSIAAVVVGGTLLSGGVGSYWGTMSGALVLTLIDSLLRAMRLEEAYQLIILGVILLVLITAYGRQRSLRQ